MKYIIFCLMFGFFLSACGSASTTSLVSQTPFITSTPELAPPPTSIIAPTIAPNPSATPNTNARLSPEQWQKWPVVPPVTGRVIEIYKVGMRLGNNLHAFSKVGDCQNIKAAFMGFFDLPDRYNLGTDYQYLQETIDNFSGYFNTDGQAVKGGFNAATVLSPLWANPEICLPGENPLECELRVTKPSIVFVSFEVWWDGRNPETYKKYMRQVIDLIIAHGAVPILASKADNVEGDFSINLATAQLAAEYDLPFWNFWLAVQDLPNHGMDAVRKDGFHISTDGWNVRSFTGLQALDSIWHGLRDTTSTSVVSSTSTPEPTLTSNLLPVSTDGPSLEFSKEKIVFSLLSRQEGLYKPFGVFLFDPTSQRIVQLLSAGFELQSASPDGKYLLVNQGQYLYRTNGLTMTLLTDKLFNFGETGALWLPDGTITFIQTGGETSALALIHSDGTIIKVMNQSESPIEIYRSTDGRHITWESGSCIGIGQCIHSGAWMTDLSSDQTIPLKGISRPLISPNGQMIAFATTTADNRSNLAFESLKSTLPRNFPLPGDILAAMSWRPGGDWLAVTMNKRSDYSGRVNGAENYLINPQDFNMRQLQSVTLLSPSVTWSPDGATLLLMGTNWQDASYSINLWEVDVASGHEVDLSDALGLKGENYLFVNYATWLVKP